MKLSSRILFVFFACALIATGCNKKLKNTLTSDVKEHSATDSITYVEKLRVDTVTVPGDTVTVSVPVFINCPDGEKPVVRQTVVSSEGKRSSIHVKVDSSGQITASSDCNTLQQEVYEKDTQIKDLKAERDSIGHYEKQVITVQIKYIPGAYKAAMWFSIIILLIALGYGIYKFNAKFPILPFILKLIKFI
jgi:hypothetical protein